MDGKAKSSRRRWPRVVALACVALIVVGVAAARLLLHGEALGRRVAAMLNGRMRGVIEIESIEWSMAAVPAVLIGGDVKLRVKGIKVWGARRGIERGELVLDVPDGTLVLDSGAAISAGHEIRISDVVLRGGGAVIAQVLKPDPAHEFDSHTVGLLDAFAGEVGSRFQAGIAASPSLVADLAHYRLEGVKLDFRYTSWSAVVEGVVGEGSLTFHGRDPLGGQLYYDVSATAPRARVTIGSGASATVVDLVDVDMPVLRNLPFRWPDLMTPPMLEYQATARTVEGAGVAVDGKLIESFEDELGGEHDLTLAVTRGGGLAGRLSGGVLGGDSLAATLRLTGPGLAPAIGLKLTGVTATVPVPGGPEPLRLEVDRASVSWNGAIGAGSLADTRIRGAGGEIALAAAFSLDPDGIDLAVDVVRPMELGAYLPPAVVKALGGGQLRGTLRVSANPTTQRVDQLDVTLGKARIHGAVSRGPDGRLHAEDLEVAVGGTSARKIRGVIDGSTGDLGIDFVLRSTDVARWLRAFEQPALARTLSGKVRVAREAGEIEGQTSLVIGGVPVVDRVEATVRYGDGAVEVREASAALYGGELAASGRLVLGDGGRAPRLEGVEARATGLDLARIPGAARLIAGHADVEARASGPAARPVLEATAELGDLVLVGEAYDDTRVTARASGGDIEVATRLHRQAGGELLVAGRLGRGGKLGGTIGVRDVPIEALAALAGRANLVGGRLDADLTLSGTVEAPTADGTIQVERGWYGTAFLGAIGVQLARVGDGRVSIHAEMFQGRVVLDGVLGTRAPFASELALRLRRAELDLLAPELAQRFGVRGWLTGELRYKGDVSAEGLARATVTAHLDEAAVVLDGQLATGQPGQLRLANRTPIDLEYRDGQLTLAHEVTLRGPTGEFALSGSASAERLALRARGRVAMSLLTPYVRQYFDRVTGEVALELEVGGTVEAPLVSGTAEVHDIAMQPTGQDTIVKIPGGKIELAGDQVSLTGLSMVVTDEFNSEKSVLTVAGGIRMAGFRPHMWGVRIDGQLDGKMLLVVAPQVFSAGYGSAELSIALLGTGLQPDIDGTLEFSPETPLTIVPRGARREIALTSGFVKFTDQLLAISEVGGTIDDEGALERVEGEISLVDWRPVDIDLTIDAGGVPVRIPGELELSVNLRGLAFVGSEEGLDIRGTLEIIDGRYIRKFNLVDDVLKPQRTSTPSVPIWESNPLLGNAALSVKIVTQAFAVKNNIANISMSGQVTLGGTPRNPRFEGVVRVDDGTFKFQGIRPTFERAGGTISFEPLRQFPTRTPNLDLRAESNYTDASGQSHLIRMSMSGTLSNMNWDLRTESGMNRTQTMYLLFAGRTPDEVRRAMGDTAIGGGPGQFADATSSGGGFVYADQLVKDLSGDFFSLLIGDSLRNLTQLDVVRIQLGTDALGFHVEESIIPSLRVKGDYESSLRGWFLGLTSEYRLTDELSLDLKYQQKNFDDQSLEDVQNGRAQATYRWILLP